MARSLALHPFFFLSLHAHLEFAYACACIWSLSALECNMLRGAGEIMERVDTEVKGVVVARVGGA